MQAWLDPIHAWFESYGFTPRQVRTTALILLFLAAFFLVRRALHSHALRTYRGRTTGFINTISRGREKAARFSYWVEGIEYTGSVNVSYRFFSHYQSGFFQFSVRFPDKEQQPRISVYYDTEKPRKYVVPDPP